MKVKNDLLRFVLSLLLCFSAALIGGTATGSAVSTWYQTINRPSWTPPSWIFGPVWTILYFLMAMSFYLIWSKGISRKTKPALNFFLIQLLLNAVWSLIFFGLANFWSAYIEIIAMWAFIFLTIKNTRKISSLAAWLLVPYILWVSFASFLNLAVALLN